MNIAILSGKGGTGKTTVSTNLALSLRMDYVDCDVEEPNGFIFMKPDEITEKKVFVETPYVIKEKCNLCGACVDACQFNALANTGKEIFVFEKLCHDCGVCKMVCRQDAIRYQKRETGVIQKGFTGDITCSSGILNVSEPMAVPVIRTLLGEIGKGNHILDCPPGTSCNVVNVLHYADAAILVTEPSEFGLHDLKLAIELVKRYNIPYGVIINKDDGKKNRIRDLCDAGNIRLLGVIPYSMEVAQLYSQGILLYDHMEYRDIFEGIGKETREVFSWNL